MTSTFLVLSDGTVFEGKSFGYEPLGQSESTGEVVFNTSLSGYQEILTDPSYSNQIIVMTYPMIGNYGINSEDVESHKIQASGFIVKEYCDFPSNHRSTQTLSQYLKSQKIVAACNMPTREIVMHIRSRGAMPGLLLTGDVDITAVIERAKKLEGMAGKNLVPEVSCKESYEISPKNKNGGPLIIAYDFGIKQNILRELSARGFRILVVPHNTKASEVVKENPAGIFLSNGPGDPSACGEAIENIRSLLGQKPILGICLGHQLLAHALGAKTFKLKFGHRGGNQPVKDLPTGKVLITAQNHGFAVSGENLPNKMKITQLNLNDQTVEGFAHEDYAIYSVQYHPEAAPGPHDANFIFNDFTKRLIDA